MRSVLLTSQFAGEEGFSLGSVLSRSPLEVSPELNLTAELQLLFCSDNRDDQLPRTRVLTFLSCLDPSDQQHERLLEELVMQLLKMVRGVKTSG